MTPLDNNNSKSLRSNSVRIAKGERSRANFCLMSAIFGAVVAMRLACKIHVRPGQMRYRNSRTVESLPRRHGISDLRSSILDCASLLLLLG